jgi:hypothetical protein
MKCATHNDLSKLSLSYAIDEKDTVDLLIQAHEFERNRECLEKELAGKVIAYRAGQLFHGDSLEETIAYVRGHIRDHPSYTKKFPPVGT